MSPSSLFVVLLQVLLIGLKLSGILTWPWVFVLLPMLLPVFVFIALSLIVLIMCFIGSILYPAEETEKD